MGMVGSTRLKFGLNLALKINLMFLQIFVLTPMFELKSINKPGTFKWAPILNKHNSYLIISNTSNLKNKIKKQILF